MCVSRTCSSAISAGRTLRNPSGQEKGPPLEHRCGLVPKSSWRRRGTLRLISGRLGRWYVFKCYLEKNNDLNANLQTLLAADQSHIRWNLNLFRPTTVPYDHEEYGMEVLKRQFRYFGPFLPNYQEIASKETVLAILYLMQEIPQSQTTSLCRVTEKEVCRADKDFIVKIMKTDWRDRPTAKALLEDEWFEVDGEE